jgi:hypothetical protein
MFNLEECQVVFQSGVSFSQSQKLCEVQILSKYLVFFPYYFSHFDTCVVVYHYGFIHASLVSNDVNYF